MRGSNGSNENANEKGMREGWVVRHQHCSLHITHTHTTIHIHLSHPSHLSPQHCFIARLHMAVDSDGLSGNRVVELNAERETKGPHNPHNNAFFFKEDVLESEQKAIR